KARFQLPGHVHGAVRAHFPVAVGDRGHLSRELRLDSPRAIEIGQTRVEDVPILTCVAAAAREEGQWLAIPSEPQRLRPAGRGALRRLALARGAGPAAPHC